MLCTCSHVAAAKMHACSKHVCTNGGRECLPYKNLCHFLMVSWYSFVKVLVLAAFVNMLILAVAIDVLDVISKKIRGARALRGTSDGWAVLVGIGLRSIEDDRTEG